LAAEKAAGPASFKTALFDCLYQLDEVTVQRRQRIESDGAFIS
jgi:hydroxyethylthiazole kinase-like sugar kinase family protein